MKFLLSSCAVLALLGLTVAPAQERDRGQTFEALRRRLDTDLDGKISEGEFPRGRAAFRRLDLDKDGFLTAADFATGEDKPAMPAQPEREWTAEELDFFEKKVRPVLVSSCYECHSAGAEKLRGGLRVDGREHLLAGGSSGAAIVPGDADESLLVQAVRRTSADLAMPPKKELAEDVVKDLERWVAMGAPWPRSKDTGAAVPNVEKKELDLAKAREFWAFQPPKRATSPATKDAPWAWSDVDRFLLAAMEAKGVAPVADADDRTWLRRVAFDLTGLPPTPEELVQFDADRSPKRFEAAVDRMLASPAFGERWGRHWLDVARYAESSGKDSNVLYPHAWRYRDWVVAALNADMPYDDFVTTQIAGDLLPAKDADERARNAIATGYLAVGSKSHTTRDRRQFQLDLADEQIDAVGQGLLGMTLACARCHDHKYDPISIEDYYGLAGVFLSTETRFGTFRTAGNNNPSELVDLPDGANVPTGPTMDPAARAVLQRVRDQAARTVDAAKEEPATGGADGERKRPDGVDLFRIRTARDQVAMLDDLFARFDEKGRALEGNKLAMGVVEGQARDIAVLERGELDKPGAIAQRGVPVVLRANASAKIGKGSGRRELATWVASAENPLTARVWVNRIWLHLFGSGLVRTPENFGTSGQAPDHPELLDWLATELVAKNWSTKAIVRELVLTHAYRLASTSDARHARVDPDAITRWRMPDRRLEAEAIRDAMLAVAGTLQREPPVGSPTGTFEGVLRRDELVQTITRERPVRSVYLPMLRDHLPDALDAFDAPDSAFVTGDRDETSVATQALFLMNDPDVMRTADAFADRLLARKGSDDERVGYAFELAFGRAPSATELGAVRSFLKDFEKLAAKPEKREERERRGRDRARDRAADTGARPIDDPRRAAWSAFAQSLFESAEFRSLG